MNYEQILQEKVALCLTLQAAKETFPFDKNARFNSWWEDICAHTYVSRGFIC